MCLSHLLNYDWPRQACYRSNLGNFTLLFGRARLTNVQSFETHELNSCSAHKIFCYAMSSLPSSWCTKMYNKSIVN